MAMSMAPTQLPLNLPHIGGSDRADLIASPANRAAIELVDAWPDWPAPLAVLVGPAGAGKSHMGGVWAHISGARVLSLRDLSGLEANEPDARLFLVEDVRPGMIPERGLFHLLNHVRAAHGYCLFTARSRPSAWNIALPDLASRLRTAAIVEIGEPDDRLLGAVLFKLLSDRQISVDPALIEYAVSRMPRSLAAAGALAAAMDTEALARRRPVSRAIVAAALERLAVGRDAEPPDELRL